MVIVLELCTKHMVLSSDTFFFLVMVSAEHFSGLKFICQRLAHRQSWTRSRWRSVVSWWSLMCLYIRQSSANNLMLELVSLLMSFMYNINIRGPKTIPCGTPDLTGASLEQSPSTTTLWDWPVNQSYPVESAAPDPIVLEFSKEALMGDFVKGRSEWQNHAV